MYAVVNFPFTCTRTPRSRTLASSNETLGINAYVTGATNPALSDTDGNSCNSFGHPRRRVCPGLCGTFSARTRAGLSPSGKPVNAGRKRHVPSAPAVSPSVFPRFSPDSRNDSDNNKCDTSLRKSGPRCRSLAARVGPARAYNRKRSLDFTGSRRCHVVPAPACGFWFSAVGRGRKPPGNGGDFSRFPSRDAIFSSVIFYFFPPPRPRDYGRGQRTTPDSDRERLSKPTPHTTLRSKSRVNVWLTRKRPCKPR